jgi:hypothetical protein
MPIFLDPVKVFEKQHEKATCATTKGARNARIGFARKIIAASRGFCDVRL